jgi:hypothetical protein
MVFTIILAPFTTTEAITAAHASTVIEKDTFASQSITFTSSVTTIDPLKITNTSEVDH